MNIIVKKLNEFNKNIENMENNFNKKINQMDTKINIIDKKITKLKPIEINEKLDNVSRIKIKSIDDLLKLPKSGGNYWIVTNEPINHTMHTNDIPKQIELKIQNEYVKHTIIYNGSAKDLKQRCKNHLLRNKNKGLSGISIDLLITKEENITHTKKALSKNKKNKSIYIDNKKIIDKNELFNMNLSKDEKEFLNNNNNETIYLYNGINVADEKHKQYDWYFFYLQESNHNRRDYNEINWRVNYGLPNLCSYKSGR